MNWDRFHGKFMQVEGAIREQWGKLSSDDIDKIVGEREQLVGRIQERYGVAREVAEKQADEWWTKMEDGTPKPA